MNIYYIIGYYYFYGSVCHNHNVSSGEADTIYLLSGDKHKPKIHYVCPYKEQIFLNDFSLNTSIDDFGFPKPTYISFLILEALI